MFSCDSVFQQENLSPHNWKSRKKREILIVAPVAFFCLDFVEFKCNAFILYFKIEFFFGRTLVRRRNKQHTYWRPKSTEQILVFFRFFHYIAVGAERLRHFQVYDGAFNTNAYPEVVPAQKLEIHFFSSLFSIEAPWKQVCNILRTICSGYFMHVLPQQSIMIPMWPQLHRPTCSSVNFPFIERSRNDADARFSPEKRHPLI